MATVALSAVARSDFGKGAARRTRRDGHIPAVIYGSGTELVHVALPAHDLDLALRKPRVVLSVEFAGSSVLVKPRDVQRDPVKRSLEHIDLVIITQAEAAERGEMADAIKAATAAAEEAGMDAASAVQALEEAVAAGEDPMAAAQHAVADAESKAEEYSEANAHEAEVEAAEAAANAPDLMATPAAE
ncbi:MAG: 50S ribosomal protein L25 [Candidatus Nanopelagicales bacterium]